MARASDNGDTSPASAETETEEDSAPYVAGGGSKLPHLSVAPDHPRTIPPVPLPSKPAVENESDGNRENRTTVPVANSEYIKQDVSQTITVMPTERAMTNIGQTADTTFPGVPMVPSVLRPPGSSYMMRKGVLDDPLLGVISATAITVTQSLLVTIIDPGGGRVASTTSTPLPYVTTKGVSRMRTTTIGLLLTTDVIVAIDSSPTAVPTIATVTPTATPIGVNGATERVLPPFNGAQYFVATFLPTIIAVILAVPIGIIDLNAKLMQPFQTLAQAPRRGRVGEILLICRQYFIEY